MKPKRYRAFHITPGVVDYTENGKRTTVLVRKEVLDKMNESFLGKPVYNVEHKILDLEKVFSFGKKEIEEHADGIISAVGYDPESGYFWVDMMIWDEETQLNIDEKGFGVSNAYIPKMDKGGTYNSVPYDEEVVSGDYNHMAVVEDPRYGDVKIFENSKKGKKMIKFKLFGKKEEMKKNAEEEKKKEDPAEEMSVNMDSMLVDEEGNEIPLSEMVEAYKAKSNTKEEENTVNMEDTMEIDGKEVSMKDLYDSYMTKDNAEDPTSKPLEEVVKQNSSDKEAPNENFLKLKMNSEKGAETQKIKLKTRRNRLEQGSARYGSAVVAKEVK